MRGSRLGRLVALTAVASAAAVVGESPLVPGPLRAQDEPGVFPEPSYSEAGQLWQEGDPAAALLALDRRLADGDGVEGHEEPELEALVLRATLLDATDEGAAAEALWRRVVERAVFLRTFARRALVAGLVARGRPAEAETVLAELMQGDPARHLDLVVRVADAHREAGDASRAGPLYRRVTSTEPRGRWADAARLGLATVLETAGDPGAALDMLREAKLRHDDGRTFDTAHRREERVAASSGVTRAPLVASEYRALVRRLRGASRFDSALAMIDEWRAMHAGPSGSAEIEVEWIDTLYAKRANDEAVAACQEFYRRFSASTLTPDVRLTDFRLAVRMLDTDRARQTGLDLWQGRVAGSTAEHRWNAGNLLAAYLVAVGDVDAGLDLYRELFAAADAADRQREILWRAGVAALRAGETGRALTNLRALLDRGPTDDLLPAGLFWLAMAEAEGDAAGATRRLQNVARRFPYHYYGLRAREALAAEGHTVDASSETTRSFPSLAVASATREQAEFRAATVLARAGLTSDAAWYLRRLLDRRRSDRGLAWLAARVSAAAGDHASALRILLDHFYAFLQAPADNVPADFWRLAYPRPFWTSVRHWGEVHAVEPNLLVSLMRRESRFDAEARSAVGAVGLFQIMTYTAEALAERAGVGDTLRDGIDDAALMTPFVNSAIAARLTADLLNRFGGATAPVVASYNAGEEHVDLWWGAARGISEALFVDTIPYTETRRFVREVLANLDAYRRIYATDLDR